MIRKSEGIVLKSRKFRETSLITTVYTREFGRQDFIVQGVRSARSRKKHAYFQPLSLLDIVFYYKETRDLQKLTESSSAHFYHTLQTEPLKIALAMPVVEIFEQSVRETEEQNHPLYDFFRTMLVALDEQNDQLIHLFLFYLVHLTRYLGFLPADEVKDRNQPIFFDLLNGTLSNQATNDNPPERLILDLLRTDLSGCQQLKFTNEQKKGTIGTMLQYYRSHLEGFREPGSLEVFAEVFN